MEMMIEGEIGNFIMVWTVATASLCYSYIVGKVVPRGRCRLVALLPPIAILLLLPLRLTSIHLAGPSSFFLSWLSTFKLLLFAFGKGPLSPNPPLSLLHFLPIASLPIKFQDHHHHHNNRPPQKRSINYRYIWFYLDKFFHKHFKYFFFVIYNNFSQKLKLIFVFHFF